MARRRYFGRRGRHGRKAFKLPVLTLAILGIQTWVAYSAGGNLGTKVNAFQRMYTGVDFNSGKFVPTYLLFGYGPWLAKGLITRFARPMGAVPRVPLGLPISIS